MVHSRKAILGIVAMTIRIIQVEFNHSRLAFELLGANCTYVELIQKILDLLLNK